ncbi:MAG: hypothetical protein Q9219_000210, partial [cf. Caloplaca sp. 3 TL-2023]
LGDQHKVTSITENPYEEVKSHINEYTAQEIATLSSRLEKQLGPEYISTRPGASGQRVPYLAADKCINLANEVFGFNGWSSGIQQVQIDFVDESQSTGKISLGLSVIVRVTLRDGTYHEDIGYGHIENCKGKAAAFEKAKKEGTTDALKRALRNFGNILGNCVYDKDYISRVTKIKVAPSKWNPDNLHRHPDYAPAKRDATPTRSHDPGLIKVERNLETDTMGPTAPQGYGAGEPDDEFATDDFDEADFGVDHEVHHGDLLSEQMTDLNNTGSAPSGVDTTDTHLAFDGMNRRQQKFPQSSVAQSTRHPHAPHAGTLQDTHIGPKPNLGPTSIEDSLPARAPQRQSTSPAVTLAATTHDTSIGFFTARVAETVQNSSSIPLEVPSFNPHLESPSIRKTAGVDHSKTKPVGRDIVGKPHISTTTSPTGRANFVNPQADKTRRVGMPVGTASPLSNRGSYKPPQMKRLAEASAVS